MSFWSYACILMSCHEMDILDVRIYIDKLGRLVFDCLQKNLHIIEGNLEDISTALLAFVVCSRARERVLKLSWMDPSYMTVIATIPRHVMT